jgi:hypothetical protein
MQRFPEGVLYCFRAFDGRTSYAEQYHASQIQSSAESRRRGALGQAWRHTQEQAPRGIQADGQLDERKQLEELAATKRKGKPERAAKKK